MQTDTHGVAIICERHDGHTVAWVDHHTSKQVPAGYFTETWVDHKRNALREIETHAGTLADGYITMPVVAGLRHPSTEFAIWRDWYDAVLWCREDARRKERAA